MQVAIKKNMPLPAPPTEYTLTLIMTEKEKQLLRNLIRWAMKRGPSLADQGIQRDEYELLGLIESQL